MEAKIENAENMNLYSLENVVFISQSIKLFDCNLSHDTNTYLNVLREFRITEIQELH